MRAAEYPRPRSELSICFAAADGTPVSMSPIGSPGNRSATMRPTVGSLTFSQHPEERRHKHESSMAERETRNLTVSHARVGRASAQTKKPGALLDRDGEPAAFE